MPRGGVTNHIGVRRRARHLLVTRSFQHRSTTCFCPEPLFAFFIYHISPLPQNCFLPNKFFSDITFQDGHFLPFSHSEAANNRKAFVHKFTMTLIIHLFYSVTTALDDCCQTWRVESVYVPARRLLCVLWQWGYMEISTSQQRLVVLLAVGQARTQAGA